MDLSLEAYNYAYDMADGNIPAYETWVAQQQGIDIAQSAGVQDPGQSGGAFWEFGTALLNVAGDVIGVLDSSGNTIPVDDLDQVNDSPAAAPDYTMYYIIGGVVLVILILSLILIFKKKKK